jgi:hypothetical protein
MLRVPAADPAVAEVGEMLLTLGTGLSLLGGVTGVPPPPPPQPTTAITASRLKPIPNLDVLRRRPRDIDPAPIKSKFRFDSFAAQRT